MASGIQKSQFWNCQIFIHIGFGTSNIIPYTINYFYRLVEMEEFTYIQSPPSGMLSYAYMKWVISYDSYGMICLSQNLFSSEPFGSLIENEVESKVEDGVILKLEEHDDAVYRKRFRKLLFFRTNKWSFILSVEIEKKLWMEYLESMVIRVFVVRRPSCYKPSSKIYQIWYFTLILFFFILVHVQ